MNGFSEDIVSILKHNVLYHRDSRGLLLGIKDDTRVRELMAQLDSDHLISTGDPNGWHLSWDYIVIPECKLYIRNLLNSLTNLTIGGIIIAEISSRPEKYEDKYVSLFAGFTVTKVCYDDRTYLVIHSGVDYGN